jgi:hypothetical protein
VDGSIRLYIPGPPNGWLKIGHDPTIRGIAAGSGLYQQRTDNSIFQYTGTPCDGSACPGWLRIDNNKNSGFPVAGSNTVYQMRTTPAGAVSIWQYTGTPCSGSVCSGWMPLDNNPETTSIVAGGVPFGGDVGGPRKRPY